MPQPRARRLPPGYNRRMGVTDHCHRKTRRPECRDRLHVRVLCVAFAALALGGCQIELLREHPLGCRGDEQRLVRDTLYFGASIPGGGEVDAAAWQRFEREVLTPAFPQGFSVLDAHGQWRGADGAIAREATHIVVLTHPDDAPSAARVREIAQAYRAQFHQESVLRERSAVCAQF